METTVNYSNHLLIIAKVISLLAVTVLFLSNEWHTKKIRPEKKFLILFNSSAVILVITIIAAALLSHGWLNASLVFFSIVLIAIAKYNFGNETSVTS